MSESNGERTEPATARRLLRAREAGQVAVSREAGQAVMLAVAALLLGPAAVPLADAVGGRLAGLLAGLDRLDPGMAARAALSCAALAILPVAGVAAIASSLAVLGQTGLLVRPAALRPDFGRIGPGAGMRRLFGGASLAEAGRAVVKFAMVGAASWQVLAATRLGADIWFTATPGVWLGETRRLALHLVVVVLAGQSVLAVLDVLRARLAMARTLRMSRHEVREEHREHDGDPRIKARIRRLRLQRARRRMMAAVPSATVVVTNPTHYAVALAYQRGSAGAPRVVAKGVDAMAERIREVARLARVPLIANAPLARALWRIELDEEVPAELFQAVAEVIAAVWRLRLPRSGL
jgi:flagellar biosynthetic protein FlhB